MSKIGWFNFFSQWGWHVTEKEESKVVERIHSMFEEAKRILEEAKKEAFELKEKRKANQKRVKHNFVENAYAKKERMLNIRIARELEEKIRIEAKKRKIPVSALVRNVLEEVFDFANFERL